MSRRGPLNKLAGLTGLAAEAIQHHRAKSNNTEAGEPASSLQDTPAAPQYSYYGESPYTGQSSGVAEPAGRSNFVTIEDGVTRTDEAVWELDNAASELEKPPTQHKVEIPSGFAGEPPRIPALVQAFVQGYPPIPRSGPADLPCPVIIPQRRPQTRARGFVRAYAPMLDEYCGIDEATWLRFLDFYDASLDSSNVSKAIVLTGSIIANVPTVTTMALSTALTAVGTVATIGQIRMRANDFVSQMNEHWFMPMGLVCVIIKYKPKKASGSFDLEQSVANATKAAHKNLRMAHGKGNEAEMPQAAPLVFPGLDHAQDKEKMNKFKRSMKFVSEYTDRRAQAYFVMENPDSALAQATKDQLRFESDLADPSKTAGIGDMRTKIHSGFGNARRQMRGTFSEYVGLGGGLRGHTPGSRGGLLGRGAAQSGYSEDDQMHAQQQQTAAGGLGGGWQLRGNPLIGNRPTPLTFISKMLSQDVLYMMIAPLPSQEEIAGVQAHPPPGLEIVDVQV